MTTDRRRFLQTSSLLALGAVAPRALALPSPTARDDARKILVVVQLSGGNDGINTVVPYRDPGYAKNRDSLRLAEDQLLKLDDHVGLHPSLKPLMKLIEHKRLSVVQGVGYDEPDRSHFRSMAIWHHARRNPDDHTGVGWIGRALDKQTNGLKSRDPAALFVGGGAAPTAIRGHRAAAAAIERVDDFLLAPGIDPRKLLAKSTSGDDVESFVARSLRDACKTSDRIATLAASRSDAADYPGFTLARRLRLIASLLKVGHGSRVYYVSQGGYDTHSSQLNTHASLLTQLARSIEAFLKDLESAKLDDRVTLLLFSEFGRTLQENASAGTDHGTAGPVFIAGKNLAKPVLGTAPDLEDLVDGEPKAGIDFRTVYATLLDEVLGVPAPTVVPGVQPLPLFAS